MLKIGDFSKLSLISIRMLRHYDEIGLLTPAVTDRLTAYRYYSEAQLPVAARINALKDMGFGLSAIAELLTRYGDAEALTQALRLKKAELDEQAEQTARQLRLVDTAITRLRKDDTNMNYNVTLKELPERKVASVRQIIPTYEHEGTLWKILMEESAPLRIQYAEPCYAAAVFHDKEYKEADVDVEVLMTVKGDYPDGEHIVFRTEPTVLIASCVFKGSYEKMPEVNAAVANWIRDNGYTFSGAAFNIYHVSPNETQDPEAFVTEVCYPVTKA